MHIYGDVYINENSKVEEPLLEPFIINLEAPITTSFTQPALGKINLSIIKENFINTFEKLPLAVNLANNHIMDFGDNGFNETLSELEDLDIKFFGAGSEENNFNNPLIIPYEGKKTAFLGYCCQTTYGKALMQAYNRAAPLDMDLIKQDILNVKNKVDFVVVSLHWGDEEVYIPKPSDVKKAHYMIELGADLIIGHHAHLIQSHEVYKGKNIFYGIGNFIFPDFSVNALYRENGSFVNYSKKQLPQNRKSVEVSLDNHHRVSYKEVLWLDGRLKRNSAKLHSFTTSKEWLYSLVKNICLKKLSIQGFLRRPRVPTINNLVSFFSKH